MYDAKHYYYALEQFLETVSLFGYDQRKVDNNLKSIVSLGGFQFQTPSFQDYNQKEIEKSKRKLVDLITGIRRSLPTDSYRYPTLTEDYVHDALIGALDEAIEE